MTRMRPRLTRTNKGSRWDIEPVHYDTCLKELLNTLPAAFFRLILGVPMRALLPMEFPLVQACRPDILGWLDDDRIGHVELQSGNDLEMHWRMLGYYVPIQRAYPRAEIVQVVLYVGDGPLRMRETLETPALRFRYRLIDARTLDPATLLASPNQADRLLAILCGANQSRSTLRRIMDGWAGLDVRQRTNAARKLLILCGLRRLEEVAREEMRRMPITADIREHRVIGPWIEKIEQGIEQGRREGREEGREEGIRSGEAKILRAVLEQRFGPLPRWAVDRIEAAGAAVLENWAVRSVSAVTLEQALE